MKTTGDEICAGCGKAIGFNEPSYYRKDLATDIGAAYHSACGDPFGIKAAVAAEREACATVAEMTETWNQILEHTDSQDIYTGTYYTVKRVTPKWRDGAAIAAAIRERTSLSPPQQEGK